MKVPAVLGLCLVFQSWSVSTSRVLELGDKFIELSGDGPWLVKFYAPWCAHCRRLEPIWAHVAQALTTSPIRVAKVDCSRYTSVATHFKIRGFPTIMFIKENMQHEYDGERTKEDLVQYALRMSRPAIQLVTKSDNIEYLKEISPIYFAFVGIQKGPLWEMFSYHANRYQQHSAFYTMSHDVAKRDIQLPSPNNSVYVYKENEMYFFPVDTEMFNDIQHMNRTMDKWMNAERFGTFPKVTRSNIHHLMDTEKYLVLAVVEENKLNEITQVEQDFKDMVESIIRNKKSLLHRRFQFGWVGSPDLANSIAMSVLPIPHLIVLNSSTSHHHIPEDDPLKLTPEAIYIFLDEIDNQIAPTYGGNSFLMRWYRMLFEARTSLVDMWRGNPVLTALVFGLPLGFLSLIFYSICCADIMDAEDEDLAQGDHEKED